MSLSGGVAEPPSCVDWSRAKSDLTLFWPSYHESLVWIRRHFHVYAYAKQLGPTLKLMS